MGESRWGVGRAVARHRVDLSSERGEPNAAANVGRSVDQVLVQDGELTVAVTFA